MSRSSATGDLRDVGHTPAADLSSSDEPGEEPAPGGEADHGDGEAQDVRLRESADHQQAQIDADDVPPSGDEDERDCLVDQPEAASRRTRW